MSNPEQQNAVEGASDLDLDVSVGAYSFSAHGRAEMVLDAFGQFQTIISDPAVSAPSSTPRAEEPSGESHDADQDEDREKAGDERVPLPVFLKSKILPRGNHVVALGIAVWAKRHSGVDELDVDTAKGYWRDSGRKVPANVSRDLGTAASEGWLERLTNPRGSFRLTGFGETYFDELESA